MKNIIRGFILVFSVCFLLFNTLAFAQESDAAAVRATIESHYTAIHAKDTLTIQKHHLPEFTAFAPDGRLLMEAGAAEAAARMGSKLDFGKSNVYMNHFNAQIYGDVAVATFYLVGSLTLDGKTKNRTTRVTAVWVRKGEEWKEAHHHESPLKGELNQ